MLPYAGEQVDTLPRGEKRELSQLVVVVVVVVVGGAEGPGLSFPQRELAGLDCVVTLSFHLESFLWRIIERESQSGLRVRDYREKYPG